MARNTPTEADVTHDQEAERAVLGSLLLDPGALAALAEFLHPDDFFRQSHRLIYRAALALYERREPTDYLLLAGELRRRGELEDCGGESYLAALLNDTPTAVHAEFYGRRVEKAAILRRLLQASGRIANAVYDGAGDVEETVDACEAALFEATNRGRAQRGAWTPSLDLMADYYGRLDAAASGRIPAGLTTGYAMLDRFTGGLQRSDLVVLAARPGLGKTSLALGIAEHVALSRGETVGIVSLEMGKEQLAHRLVSARARVDGHRLRGGYLQEHEWLRVAEASGQLGEAPLFVDDSPNLTALEVRARARRLHAERGLALLIVDYLQLMQGTSKRRNDGRVQEVSEISRSLKALAKELDVPVLALAQLSRAVERRPGGRPQLSDLRESGQIEMDADVVLFLWHPPDDPPERLQLLVAKQRNGPVGEFPIAFRPYWTRFEDLETRYDEAAG